MHIDVICIFRLLRAQKINAAQFAFAKKRCFEVKNAHGLLFFAFGGAPAALDFFISTGCTFFAFLRRVKISLCSILRRTPICLDKRDCKQFLRLRGLDGRVKVVFD